MGLHGSGIVRLATIGLIGAAVGLGACTSVPAPQGGTSGSGTTIADGEVPGDGDERPTPTSMADIGDVPESVAPASVDLPSVGPTRDTIHVSDEGDDTNGGTSTDDALASIQAGVDRARPGDVVLVAPGSYEGSIEVSQSGEPDAWIVIRSAEAHAARVIIPSGFRYESGFFVTGDYIKIEGFEIFHEANGPDQWGGGIAARDAHHTWVVDNIVRDVGGAGIEFLQSDYSIAERNIVYNTSNWSQHQNSGINIYQARASDDVPGIHNVIRGNVSYGNFNLTPKEDGTTDGNGIVIDDTRNAFADDFDDEYAFGTLVENNLVYGNGGRGIQVFQSDHVVVRNNTAFGNNQDKRNPSRVRGDLSSNRSSDVVWVNNVAVAVAGDGVLAFNVAFVVSDSEGITFTSNLVSGQGTRRTISVEDDDQMAFMGGNLIDADPMFVSATVGFGAADFSVRVDSPAIDAGIDLFGLADVDLALLPRVSGAAVDIGAFEFGGG